jgi:hypothetical protein
LPKESKFPINRIVAFAGPYIAILSGVIANWLLVHLHFLSSFHTQSSSITKWLTQALVFGFTAGLTWLGHQKWLTGWQKWETMIASEVFNGPGLEPALQSDEYDPAVAGGDSEPVES